MAADDSDSSMSDDHSIEQATDVVLGYASKEPTCDNISHLGGEPQWPDQAQAASFAYSRCTSCTNPMPLLLQLNADLTDRFPTHERRLFLWACRAKRCRRKTGSARAVRAVKVHEDTRAEVQSKAKQKVRDQETPPKLDLGAALFGGARSSGGIAVRSTPFEALSEAQAGSTNPSASAPKPPALGPNDDLSSTFAQKARISDPIVDALPHPKSQHSTYKPVPYEEWPTTSSDVAKPYPRQYLDAEQEYLCPSESTATTKPHYTSFMDVEETSATSANSSTKKDIDLPDDTLDKTFQQFADTLNQNPEQVLRYQFGGRPLLYRRNDAVGRLFATPHEDVSASDRTITTVSMNGSRAPGPPRCEHCGANRVFECQLTPGMIAALEEGAEGLNHLEEGMEWGTIIVAGCEKDCIDMATEVGDTEYREEWVGVQWEEIVQRGVSKAAGAG